MEGKMNPKIYAIFSKKGDNKYRNSTELIYNSQNVNSGIILMLNPGGCKPSDPNMVITETPTKHLCNSDNILDLVIKWLPRFYKKSGKDLPHKVFIINLCDKIDREPNNLRAIDFNKDVQKIEEEIEKVIKNNNINWFWAAYGSNQNVPSKLKSDLPSLHKKYKEILIGNSVNFGHPGRKRREYWKNVFAEFIEKINNSQ